jgi:hypothetical protein
MSNITVSLPDGSERELAEDATALDLAASIGSGLKKAAVAAVVDGTETDLTAPLRDGATVSIITADTDEGRHVLRHSTAHVMAQAVTRLFPGAKFSIGPAIENGFYYDFELPGGHVQRRRPRRIEAEMRAIVAAEPAVRAFGDDGDEAKELFADQPYKVEIIERVDGPRAAPAPTDTEDSAEVAPGGVISAYRNTESFVDMCVGRTCPPRAGSASSSCNGVGRLLARRREGPDAATHLRHGVGVEAGARGAPPPPRGGAQARPPQARDRARPAELPERARRRARRVAPEGRHRPQAHGGLQPYAPRARRLRVRVHAAPGQREALRDLRASRLLRRRDVPAHGDGQRHVLHEADELPDALPDLPQPPAQLPRAAPAVVRARHVYRYERAGTLHG